MLEITNTWRKDLEPVIKKSIEELKYNIFKQKDFSTISLKLSKELQSIQAEADIEQDNKDDR